MDNKNQPAYPISEETTDRIDKNIKIYTGLSKREYFAALAMQGICANQMAYDAHYEKVADWSVRYADALLAELEKISI